MMADYCWTIKRHVPSNKQKRTRAPKERSFESKKARYPSFFACEQLLQRQNQKGFIHRIVTGDEKWVNYDNPKRRKSWGMPGHASTSTATMNYALFKPSKTITGERYRTQWMCLSRALKEKRPQLRPHIRAS